MGCFDSVCSVSHLPISHGDEIVVFYLGQKRQGRQAPICLPIFGQYNDYGEIENYDETSIGWRYFTAMLETRFKGIVPDTFRASEGLEAFRDAVHMDFEGQPLPAKWADNVAPVFEEETREYSKQTALKLVKGNNTRVSKMFVHRKVYDRMVAMYKKRLFGWNEKFTGQSLFDDIPEFVDECIKRDQLLKKYFVFERDDDKEQRLQLLLDNEKYNISLFGSFAPHREGKFGNQSFWSRIFEHGNDRYDPMFRGALYDIRDTLNSQFEHGSRESAIELLTAYLEMDAFGQMLSFHNMEYHAYAGFACEQHQGVTHARVMIDYYQSLIDMQQKKIDTWIEDIGGDEADLYDEEFFVKEE